MPIGSFAAIPLLAQTLVARQPSSVLDLGLGFGGGGVVVRQWLDLGVQPYRTHLVGVEGWAEYRNPVWDLYNVIHVQKIESYLQTSREKFECVLLNDVLEHFDKPEGGRILEQAKQFLAPRGLLVVVTPAKFFPQEAVYGNELERHRSLWSKVELEQRGFHVLRAGSESLCCGECWLATWRSPQTPAPQLR